MHSINVFFDEMIKAGIARKILAACGKGPVRPVFKESMDHRRVSPMAP